MRKQRCGVVFSEQHEKATVFRASSILGGHGQGQGRVDLNVNGPDSYGVAMGTVQVFLLQGLQGWGNLTHHGPWGSSKGRRCKRNSCLLRVCASGMSSGRNGAFCSISYPVLKHTSESRGQSTCTMWLQVKMVDSCCRGRVLYEVILAHVD